jgi:hypothetical protein
LNGQPEKESIQKPKVRAIEPSSFVILQDVVADIYHITWNVPNSREIQDRLVQSEENSEKRMQARLKEHRR